MKYDRPEHIVNEPDWRHSMTTPAENIAFIIVRGIVALSIVGVGFFCIGQGIHYFGLPRVEAEQIRVSLLGLEITASGLGAVIFGTGVALSYLGKRAAPNRFETHRSTETLGPPTQISNPTSQDKQLPPPPLSGDIPDNSDTSPKPVVSGYNPPLHDPFALRSTESRVNRASADAQTTPAQLLCPSPSESRAAYECTRTTESCKLSAPSPEDKRWTSSSSDDSSRWDCS